MTPDPDMDKRALRKIVEAFDGRCHKAQPLWLMELSDAINAARPLLESRDTEKPMIYVCPEKDHAVTKVCDNCTCGMVIPTDGEEKRHRVILVEELRRDGEPIRAENVANGFQSTPFMAAMRRASTEARSSALREIQRCVEQEREACAKIADHHASCSATTRTLNDLQSIAQAIRNREDGTTDARPDASAFDVTIQHDTAPPASGETEKAPVHLTLDEQALFGRAQRRSATVVAKGIPVDYSSVQITINGDGDVYGQGNVTGASGIYSVQELYGVQEPTDLSRPVTRRELAALLRRYFPNWGEVLEQDIRRLADAIEGGE